MSLAQDAALQAIAERFALGGPMVGSRTISSGHIHDTLAATVETPTGPRDYILQCMNHHVFTQPLQVMDNISRVTRHLRAKLLATPGADPARQTLTIVPTLDGADCVRVDGEYWRAFTYITDTVAYDIAPSDQHAYQAALAFGRFQRQLADLDAPALYETIPKFHYGPGRFATLRETVGRDPEGRAAGCRPELDFAMAHEALIHTLADPLARGGLPLRTVHNDTKLNNVLFDIATDEAVCVIDLDTVMPGTALYDFGDQVRSTGGDFDEGTTDLDSVRLDMGRFTALVAGYLEATRGMLTDTEIDAIAVAGQVITFTIGVRFLADHLNGDRYFRIHHPGQNLERARVQFAYVRDMMARRADMEAVVAKHR